MMECKDIGFGTYDCSYNVMLPWFGDDGRAHTVAIDKCLLAEVVSLWEQGIKTTGCCCGHGRQGMAFIGVRPEHIPKMKELGYEVWFNECRPGDEDSFVPKTKLEYGEIRKGFNWWDGEEDK